MLLLKQDFFFTKYIPAYESTMPQEPQGQEKNIEEVRKNNQRRSKEYTTQPYVKEKRQMAYYKKNYNLNKDKHECFMWKTLPPEHFLHWDNDASQNDLPLQDFTFRTRMLYFCAIQNKFHDILQKSLKGDMLTAGIFSKLLVRLHMTGRA